MSAEVATTDVSTTGEKNTGTIDTPGAVLVIGDAAAVNTFGDDRRMLVGGWGKDDSGNTAGLASESENGDTPSDPWMLSPNRYNYGLNRERTNRGLSGIVSAAGALDGNLYIKPPGAASGHKVQVDTAMSRGLLGTLAFHANLGVDNVIY